MTGPVRGGGDLAPSKAGQSRGRVKWSRLGMVTLIMRGAAVKVDAECSTSRARQRPQRVVNAPAERRMQWQG